MLRKLLFILAFCLVAVPFAFAQTGTIEGTIIDAKSGESVPGANVLLVETKRGSATDAQGTYHISGVPEGTYTLRVSFVGYKESKIQVEILAGETTKQDVKLKTGSVGLDEVVVTGFGEVEKDKYTGSISTVSSEDIEDVPATTVSEALKGNVAGAQFSSASGTPGSPQQIRIRGISSINAGTSPLYVIDGVPVDNISSGGDGSSPLGSLASLSSSDIESVNILKGAAATAPYGARGANGVVVIKTKEGKSGEATYSVSAQMGVSSPAVHGPETVTGKQWDKYFRVAKANYFGSGTTPSDITSPWDGKTSTDYRDEYFRDKADALTKQYALSARGGNDKTTFYASGSYYDKKGIAVGVEFDRISGKLNISHKLDDWITIDNNFTGSYVNQVGATEGSAYFANPYANIYFQIPIDPVYNDDGSYNHNFNNAHYNAAAVQDRNINRKRNYRVLNNTRVKAQILDNLSFSTRFNIDFNMIEGKDYRNAKFGGGAGLGGDVSDNTDRFFNYVWKNKLRYNWALNENNTFDIQAIAESQKSKSRYLSGYGTGVAAEGLVNLDTTADPQGVGSSTYDWAVQSFTGIVNYSFKEKYIVDASIRREGNSRLSDKTRWGNFWSLGVGYVLTEEQFLQDISWLDFLKVRTSYGKTGNASIGLNSYQATVGFGSYSGQPDIIPNNLGNRNLTWEKQKALDAAVEFRMFNNRVEGSATYYRQNSYDMLFDVPLSRTTGHNSQTKNLGKLYNQGLELELSGDIIQNDNFTWNLGANFTRQKNEVTQLPKDPNGEDREVKGSTKYTAVKGYETGAWYMKEWAGVDPANGDPLWYMDDGNGGRKTTNDYSKAEAYYQGGNALADKFGGINTQVNVFGFYASANLYYAFGNKVYDNWGFYTENGGYSLFNGKYADQMDYWEKPGDQAKNPKPIWGGNKNANGVSTKYLYDGDYLRLSTIKVGYDIPAKYLQNIGLKSAKVFFIGQNLWTYTFDDELEFDPDVNAGGYLDFQGAPQKSFTFGIKADF